MITLNINLVSKPKFQPTGNATHFIVKTSPFSFSKATIYYIKEITLMCFFFTQTPIEIQGKVIITLWNEIKIHIYLLTGLIKQGSAVMALNLYVQTQAFPKSTIRMLYFHVMKHGICVDSCTVFLTLVLWHLKIEIKVGKKQARSFSVCGLRKISTTQ